MILDEAHTIEQVAAIQLGLRVSQAGLRFDLQRLVPPADAQGPAEGRSRKPRRCGGRGGPGRRRAVLSARWAMSRASASFSTECRVREPEVVPNTLGAPLRQLWQEIDDLAADVEVGAPRGRAAGRVAALARTRTGRSRCFSTSGTEDSVYWVERGGRDEHPDHACTRRAVKVADRLRPLLFSRPEPAS